MPVLSGGFRGLRKLNGFVPQIVIQVEMGVTDNTGHKQVTDEQIIGSVRKGDFPVATAKEIAADLPITRDAVNKRLRRLVSDGQLRSKKVGGAAKVYCTPDMIESVDPHSS
jgi:predicted transcriptional regulator